MNCFYCNDRGYTIEWQRQANRDEPLEAQVQCPACALTDRIKTLEAQNHELFKISCKQSEGYKNKLDSQAKYIQTLESFLQEAVLGDQTGDVEYIQYRIMKELNLE